MTPPDTNRVFAERRRRVARIRKQVTTLAVVVFVALWGVIFFQLVSGHDPVLSARASTTATTSPSAATTSTTSASSSSSTALTTSQS